MSTTAPTGNAAIEAKKCITPEGRASWPSLFKAKSFNNQEAKYSLAIVFPNTADLSGPKRAVKNCLIEKFGPDQTRWPDKKKLRLPFRDGADKEGTEGYGAGKIFITASSKTAPGLVNQRLERILNESDFYAGCWCRAELIAFYYDVNGNKGVSFSLQNVQKIRDDKPFSGRKAAEDVFGVVDDGSDDPSAYGGADTEADTNFGL